MTTQPVRPPDEPEAEQERSNISQLRRLVVVVLLGLLIFVTVGEFIASVVGLRYTVDASFYALVGGMIAGLFSAEVVSALFKRK